MAVGFSNTNKPLNPRGQDASPKGYNRAALFSGKALDFDGVNDHITIPNSDSVNITGDALTIAGYINTDGSTAWQGICYKDGGNNKGYQLFVDKTGDPNIAFGVHTGTFYRLYSNEVIKNDKWYFVVATYDGVNQSIYINGVFDNSQAVTGNITDSSTQNLYIGRNNTGSERFNGEIGGFKVFNTALTAAQVADLYNNPEKVVPTGVDNTALKLWLPMMEGAGTTAYDGSGNGNHGTISGATYVNGIGAPSPQSAVMDWNKGTNLVAYSTDLISNWSLNGGTWTSGQDDPIGGANAYKITSTGSDPWLFKNATSGISGTQYTAKCWVKGAVGREARLWIIRDNVNFESEDFTLTGDWQEIETTKTFPTTPTSFVSFRLDIPNDTPGSGDVGYLFAPRLVAGDNADVYVPTLATAQTSEVLLPQGLTTGRDITGVNLFENVRKQGALNLDGNSWAEVHDNESLDITDAITLEAWVYWDGAIDKGILGKHDYYNSQRSYLLYKNTSTEVRFYVSSNGISLTFVKANTTFANKNWYHLLGVYDGAELIIYVNGVEDNSVAYTSGIYGSNNVLEIGRYGQSVNAAHEYTDQIAQPRIYNRALTASEILRNYNSGKNTYTND